MDWLVKLAEVRGKRISEYKVDAIAKWIESFSGKHGRLPEKGELLAEVERLCELNLWNRDLVTKLRSHVFGEEVERQPSNPVEELLAKLKVTNNESNEQSVDTSPDKSPRGKK